jgi:hypothetical protein
LYGLASGFAFSACMALVSGFARHGCQPNPVWILSYPESYPDNTRIVVVLVGLLWMVLKQKSP